MGDAQPEVVTPMSLSGGLNLQVGASITPYTILPNASLSPAAAKCDVYIRNVTGRGMPSILVQEQLYYGGIPFNLGLNMAAWVLLLLLFAVLRKIAWDYGRLALMSRADERTRVLSSNGKGADYDVWTSIFYGDHEPPPEGKNLDEETSVGRESRESLSSHPVAPGVHDRGFCSWVPAIFKIKDDMIAYKCGLDAVQYMTFQRYVLVLMTIITVFSIAVLLPVNFSGMQVNFSGTQGETEPSNSVTVAPSSQLLRNASSFQSTSQERKVRLNPPTVTVAPSSQLNPPTVTVAPSSQLLRNASSFQSTSQERKVRLDPPTVTVAPSSQLNPPTVTVAPSSQLLRNASSFQSTSQERKLLPVNFSGTQGETEPSNSVTVAPSSQLLRNASSFQSTSQERKLLPVNFSGTQGEAEPSNCYCSSFQSTSQERKLLPVNFSGTQGETEPSNSVTVAPSSQLLRNASSFQSTSQERKLLPVNFSGTQGETEPSNCYCSSFQSTSQERKLLPVNFSGTQGETEPSNSVTVAPSSQLLRNASSFQSTSQERKLLPVNFSGTQGETEPSNSVTVAPSSQLLRNASSFQSTSQERKVRLNPPTVLLSLLPVNFSGTQEGGPDQFGRTTVSNLQSNNPLLWLHTVFSILYLIAIVLFMRHFTTNLQYREEEHVTRTLFIRNMPIGLTDRELIKKHFMEAYPDAVVTDVQFTYNITKLMKLDKKRLAAQQAKLQTQRINERTGKPLTIKPMLCGKFCPNRCGVVEVDALEYYTQEEERLTAECEKEKKRSFQDDLGMAFVTFNSDKVAARIVGDYRTFLKGPPAASSVSTQVQSMHWSVDFAPAPDDVNWENLSISGVSWWFRVLIINLILLVFLFFLTTPAIILNTLDQWNYKKLFDGLHEIVYDFQFGTQYAWMMCIFTITTVYSITCPLIVPFGLTYMILKHLVDRYNIYYAYNPSRISPDIHNSAVNYVIAAAVLLQCSLLFFSIIRLGTLDAHTIVTALVLVMTLALIIAKTCFGVFSGLTAHKYHQFTDTDDEAGSTGSSPTAPFVSALLMDPASVSPTTPPKVAPPAKDNNHKTYGTTEPPEKEELDLRLADGS
ncbi:TMEM63B [Branchiostoma lanceolatum]|uniref:TMEM63B protein n=1 Tax=Branchiostoma lanceolatum TaxID=7740 RepID=A0A8J9ZST3_BRALA|nr:TMEM63B [Branchiostoma lanceolatum]